MTVWSRGPSGRWRASGFLVREARDAFAGWARLFFGEGNVATEDVFTRDGIEVDAAQPPLGVPLGAEGAGPAGARCPP